MKYERAKWSALHVSMLNKGSKGLKQHRRENLYKSVYCNQAMCEHPIEYYKSNIQDNIIKLGIYLDPNFIRLYASSAVIKA